MSEKRSLPLRFCLGMIQAVSLLVPRARRAAWRQEWEAEIRHRSGSRSSAASGGDLELVRRALGALPDAAWLLRQLTLDSEILQDVRHALRLLGRAPGIAAALLIVLGTAFGAVIALFAISDALVLRPLPFAEAERLVTVWQTNPREKLDKDDVSPANFLDWRESVTGFSGLAAAIPYAYDWLDATEPESWSAVQVTEGFFDVVGARPLLGRTFSKDEHASGRANVMVLTHRLWRQHFAADPHVVGRTVRLGAGVFTVVGVLAEDFELGLFSSGNRWLYTPHVVADHERRTRGSAWWNVVGRLKPGASVAAVQAELDEVSKRLAAENPRSNEGVRAPIMPLREHLIGGVRPALLTLVCGGLMLLLIAWANVSGLLVARAQARELEFAVRASLGAGRARLMRQTLTETLLFAGAGAVIGLGLAAAAVRALVRLAPVPVPRLALAGIDARAIGFAMALALVTALVCAFLPMLRLGRARLVARAREGRALGTRQAARRSLVVSQLALALVLLSACGLLLRSVAGLLSIDPGFQKDQLLALQVFAWTRNRTPASRAAFFEEAQARVASVPGVAGVGAVSMMPFSESAIDIKSPLSVEGKPVEPGSEPRVYMSVASAGYFDAMRIRLLRGRGFLASDALGGAPVAVINEVLSQSVFGGEDPLGRRLSVRFDGQPVLAEVVGVVAPVRQARLERAAAPEVYVPHAQFPFGSMTFPGDLPPRSDRPLGPRRG